MNLSISGWSLYNNPYYTGQSSRNSGSGGELFSSSSTSGDTLTLSSAFSERLAAAVQNANRNNDSSSGQNAASGQMMMPPPPPPVQAGESDSETDSVLMEQRAENLETAYNEVSQLDPENMTEEEIDAALASIKATLENGGANAVTESEQAAGLEAGFDLSALEDLSALSLEEKQSILGNLQSEIVDKYERISQAQNDAGQVNQAAAGATGGPPPGPPPGGPPPSDSDSELMEQRAANLESAYSYVSELDPESIDDTDELKEALNQIKTTLETGGANTATEAEEAAGLGSGFDLSALDELDSIDDVDVLQDMLADLKEEIISKYEGISQMMADTASGSASEGSNTQGIQAGQGPPPPGGPPPGGPPPGGPSQADEETLTSAYDYISSLGDTDDMTEEELQSAMQGLMSILSDSASAAGEEEEGSTVSAIASTEDSSSSTGSASSTSESEEEYWQSLSEDELREELGKIIQRLTEDYERVTSQQDEEADSSQRADRSSFAPQYGWSGSGGMGPGDATGTDNSQYGFQNNVMSQINVNGISGSLLNTLWNVYGQQQGMTIPGANVLNPI